MIRRLGPALAGVSQRTECRSANQRVTGLIPSQGTCLGCGPVASGGTWEATTHWCFPSSLSPLPKNKWIKSLKKKRSIGPIEHIGGILNPVWESSKVSWEDVIVEWDAKPQKELGRQSGQDRGWRQDKGTRRRNSRCQGSEMADAHWIRSVNLDLRIERAQNGSLSMGQIMKDLTPLLRSLYFTLRAIRSHWMGLKQRSSMTVLHFRNITKATEWRLENGKLPQ